MIRSLPAGARFDQSRADRALTFISGLRQTQGRWAGQSFGLLAWQRSVLAETFGTVRADGTRQYRTVYVEIPRKNGKSTLAAGVALYLLCADGEHGGQVYSAAGDREQANIVFDTAAAICRQTPALQSAVKRFASYNVKRLVYERTGSFYRSIPADAAGAHGFNASGIILDEAHTQPNRELYDVLTTSTGARTQPLTFVITTAGHDRNSLCYELHEYARMVRDGAIDDPTFLPVLYAAGEGDDWTDPAVWAKANPSLGETVSLDYLEAECRRAIQVPAYQNTFRRLHLNQWTSQETRWLPMADWDACRGDVDWRAMPEALAGRPCYVGLDLATTTDLAAITAVFPDGDGYDILTWPFIPADNMRERGNRDRVPYEEWVRQGAVTATPGNVIDYGALQQRMDAILSTYHVREIGYDPWNATQFVQRYADDGVSVVELRQGYATLSAPTKALLTLTMGRQLRHGGHPVLRWHADNALVKTDENHNVRLIKPAAGKRIDCLAALVNGLARALVGTDTTSVYEDRGLLVLG